MFNKIPQLRRLNVPVLPTVYSEALSYYEDIAFISKKMNELIEEYNALVGEMNTFTEEVANAVEEIDNSVSDKVDKINLPDDNATYVYTSHLGVQGKRTARDFKSSGSLVLYDDNGRINLGSNSDPNYAVDWGSTAVEAEGSLIAVRDRYGNVKVNEEPNDDGDATSKKYVDRKLLGKVDKLDRQIADEGVYAYASKQDEEVAIPIMVRPDGVHDYAESIVRRNEDGVIETPTGDVVGTNVIEEWLSEKVGKINEQDGATYVYTSRNGEDGSRKARDYPTSGAIPLYTNRLTLTSNAPTQNTDVTNKVYVDSKFAFTMRYQKIVLPREWDGNEVAIDIGGNYDLVSISFTHEMDGEEIHDEIKTYGGLPDDEETNILIGASNDIALARYDPTSGAADYSVKIYKTGIDELFPNFNANNGEYIIVTIIYGG